MPPFSLQQIGTSAVRFPSGATIPSITDASVDPYARTRMPKDTQVESLLFWPQEKGTYPGLVVLHEWWGLNAQVKNFANRLACEGYTVIVPNLYGRQGGMVTANVDVATDLMSRIHVGGVLQDINSCCEFMNTRDHVKRNVFGVLGFGMGGSLAIRFACHRKRLKAAVAFYAKMVDPPSLLNDLHCPLLYHQAATDDWVTAEEIEQLRQAAKHYGKTVEILTYDNAPHAFCNEMRPDVYREDAAKVAWEATVAFLSNCFKADQ
jgi:carboxymethylenebutenolidase